MHRKVSTHDGQKQSSPIDALAMLIEYALIESREIKLPLVTFLLRMTRSAIQLETMSDPPLTTSPDELEEARICPLWTEAPLSSD